MIRDDRTAYSYKQYRNAYYAAVGVHPEFDLVHKPVCAAVQAAIIDAEDLKEAKRASTKRGLMEIVTTGVKGGVAAVEYNNVPWQRPMTDAADALIPDASGHLFSLMSQKNGQIFPLVVSEFKKAMEPWKIFYSAVALAAEDYERIQALPVGEFFSSPGLGWRKTEDGGYAEGVWNGDQFVNGLMYHPEVGFFAGRIDHDNRRTTGVWALESGEWLMGNVGFALAEGQIELHDDNAIRLIMENNALFIQVGKFTHDREDGFILELLMSANGAIQVADTKYDFGNPVKTNSAERKERKKLYGSTAFERALLYYRGIAFLILGILFGVGGLAMGIFLSAEVGSTMLIVGLLFAVLLGLPFALIGISSIRSARRKTKRAKELDS